jgi:hypothetical protein
MVSETKRVGFRSDVRRSFCVEWKSWYYHKLNLGEGVNRNEELKGNLEVAPEFMLSAVRASAAVAGIPPNNPHTMLAIANPHTSLLWSCSVLNGWIQKKKKWQEGSQFEVKFLTW